MAVLDVSNQGRQRRQIVWAREGPTCGYLAECVDLIDIRPRGRQRTQSSLNVIEHDAVFAPVLPARRQNETLATPGMKGVRYFKLYARLSNHTNCSPGLEGNHPPKGRF